MSEYGFKEIRNEDRVANFRLGIRETGLEHKYYYMGCQYARRTLEFNYRLFQFSEPPRSFGTQIDHCYQVNFNTSRTALAEMSDPVLYNDHRQCKMLCGV